jgi:hypothetical protein
MSVREKAAIIAEVIWNMREAAKKKDVRFDEGDLFLALAFRTDDELREIARACGIA